MKPINPFSMLALALILTSCASQVADIKDEEHIGEKVKLSGTAENTIKIGKLSGFTLVDESGSISVSSETLPEEGKAVEVRGVLIKDTLLGYYVKADSVR